MCLVCNNFGQKQTEAQKRKMLEDRNIYLRLPNNKYIQLNEGQIKEIIDHAFIVIATSVDSTVSVWAIQWDNDYEVKTISLI